MSEIPRYSYTRLSMWSRCPVQYRFRYVEGVKRPPGIAAHVGRAVHKAAERNGAQKIDSHEDLPTKDIVEIGIEAFKNEVETDGFDGEADLGVETDKAAALTQCYAEEIAPLIQPIHVERAIVFPVGPKGKEPEFEVVGILDCEDDKHAIIDYKTKKSRFGDGTKLEKKVRVDTGKATDADTSLQLSTYTAAYVHETGKLPTDVIIDGVVATKKPYHQRIVSQRTMEDVNTTIEIYANFHKAITFSEAAGVFVPTVDPTICSWCGYRGQCKYFRKARN